MAESEYLQSLRDNGPGYTGQSIEDAELAFFGVDQGQQKPPAFGEPIPGYSGVNRRVGADNVFGMTYAEARRMAQMSQVRLDQEKKETLRETSKWVPEHKRPVF